MTKCLGTIRSDGLAEVVLADDGTKPTWRGDLAGRYAGKRDGALLVLGSSPATWVLGIADDELWLVAPLQPVRPTAAHEKALIEAASTAPLRPLERVATLTIKSRLAVQNVGTVRAHFALPAGKYDVLWEDLATPIKGKWGSFDARAFVVPHGRTPRGAEPTQANASSRAPVLIATQPKVKAVNALAFSGDGTLFAGGAEHPDPTLVAISGDKIVERWKPPGSAGSNLHTITIAGAKVCVALTWKSIVRANGKIVETIEGRAVMSPRGTLARRADKGIVVGKHEIKTDAVPVAFSADEKRLLAHSWRGAEVFEVSSGKKLATYKDARCAAFSGTGELAVGFAANVVVYSAAGKSIAKLALPAKPMPLGVAFSRDMLAVGYADRTVRVWSLATKQVVHDLGEHVAAMRAVQFSPDGKRLAVGAGASGSKASVAIYELT